MIFVELSPFARRRAEFLDDEDFRQMQSVLLQNPRMGAVIPGSRGVRKLRWSVAGRGKRGGARVIYYHALTLSHILLVTLYAKNEQDDLSPEQMRVVKALVEGFKSEERE